MIDNNQYKIGLKSQGRKLGFYIESSGWKVCETEGLHRDIFMSMPLREKRGTVMSRQRKGAKKSNIYTVQQ